MSSGAFQVQFAYVEKHLLQIWQLTFRNYAKGIRTAACSSISRKMLSSYGGLRPSLKLRVG